MRALIRFGIFCGFLLAAAVEARADKALFEQKCSACHSIGGGTRVGPDLKGVAGRRDHGWLIKWITGPDQVLAAGDPTAQELFRTFNQVPMPNLGLTPAQAESVLAYIASQGSAKAVTAGTAALAAANLPQPPASLGARLHSAQGLALIVFLGITAVIVFVFWRVRASGADPVPAIDMDAAYRLRSWLFVGALVVVLGTIGATLSRTPYPGKTDMPDHVVYATAKQFAFSFSSEPVTSDQDLAAVPMLSPLTLPSGSLVEFRVTSLDVTHGFGIYGPDGNVLTQTQAMPGYVNRLRVRFPAPGKYTVLCLEFCGLAHHMMRSEFIVQ